MAKRRARKKKVVELTPEELEFQAKQKKAMNKKGVWEVTLDDGVVLGLFQGTPTKIGAFVIAQQAEMPQSLYFQLTKIRDVPEQIAKAMCCERKFTRKDNFCPLCGQPKNVNPGIPNDITIECFTELG
ncbi:MAG: hypothetical protein P1V97_12085 [Planctomycetota bacterium]|nr:hypothetical protein [Planctomycetota bacterium]